MRGVFVMYHGWGGEERRDWGWGQRHAGVRVIVDSHDEADQDQLKLNVLLIAESGICP
jgi:hypothetical protein